MIECLVLALEYDADTLYLFLYGAAQAAYLLCTLWSGVALELGELCKVLGCIGEEGVGFHWLSPSSSSSG